MSLLLEFFINFPLTPHVFPTSEISSAGGSASQKAGPGTPARPGLGRARGGAAGPPDSAGAGAREAAAPTPGTDTAPPSRARSPAFGKPGVRQLLRTCQHYSPRPRLYHLAEPLHLALRPPPAPQPSPPQRLLQALPLSGRFLQAGRRSHQNVLEGAQQFGSLTLQPGPERLSCPLPAGAGRGRAEAEAGTPHPTLQGKKPPEAPVVLHKQGMPLLGAFTPAGVCLCGACVASRCVYMGLCPCVHTAVPVMGAALTAAS